VLRASFRFEDEVRRDAPDAVAELQEMRLRVMLVSGDTPEAVSRVAGATGIEDARAGLSPQDKVHAVEQGRTMMVGDGINDAPALRAAHVSMAPSSATDIGRQAADFVFTTGRLQAVPFALGLARRVSRLVTQNLAFAVIYNTFAVPLAISGQVTPLIAAIAMSSSSLVVVGNGLRLRWSRPTVREAVPLPLLATR
jgi:Cu2+-exporting ATPase